MENKTTKLNLQVAEKIAIYTPKIGEAHWVLLDTPRHDNGDECFFLFFGRSSFSRSSTNSTSAILLNDLDFPE